MTSGRLAGWALGVSLLAAAAASAGDWANWRGPSYNGATDETGLPVQFSPTQGVKWSTELPGPSAATPIVYGDSVFVTAAEMQKQQLLAVCVDRATGKIRWQQVVGNGYRPADQGSATQLDGRSNYASPSPVTDGKRVVFFYGSGDLAAFDFQGRPLWSRNIQQDYGDFCFNWTFSSSPQLYEGKLYLQILQRDRPIGPRGREGSDSYLLAMDPATGKELWKASRPSPARMESREAYSTPIPFVHNGRKELVIVGGDVVTGHDPATGKELWRWGTYNPEPYITSYRLVPSPVTGGDRVLICAPKAAPVYAIKAGAGGDVSESGLAWSSPQRSEITSDVPTPLFYRGKFFIQSDVRKAMTCVDPADGKIIWSTPLPVTSMCWASPTGADGKIYTMTLRGEVQVLDADTGKILASNPMAEGENEIRSTIAISGGHMFIRTNTRLFCVGK